ncbi:MAG: TonB family protein [Opitutae bacterium]|nr:TonB family protein [Opitutae bacterium]
MQSKHIVLATALLGLLSTTAFAATPAAHRQATASLQLDYPAPAKVVSPTNLPRTFEGATVVVSLTIDESGQPHDVKVVSAKDRLLTKSLVSAVSQWRFTPARKNGTPVATKVLLPLELVES